MRKTAPLALAGAVALALSACSGGGPGSEDPATGEITYWLWDSNQLPAYQACADAFTAANPDITVKIEQFAWDDYWTKLTASFVGGSGPDVFVDHLSKYGEFAAQGQIVPLDERIEQDGFDTGIYADGLLDPWQYADGSTYGLPKDFDTTAFFYNADLLDEAGITAEDLWAADWNPDDGGTFEDIIAHLTVDANGVRGDEDGFDPSDVEVYGMGINPNFEETGQMQWANFTGTLDWDYLDTNPWGTRYNFDDPEFQKAVDWFYGLAEKGYAPAAGVFSEETLTQVGSGSVALGTNGSWATRSFMELDGVDVGIAPGPVGPTGERASLFNGVADSISASSDKQDAAWQWVQFLGSTDCQDIVAEHAVVFPAIPESADAALAAFEEKGWDVSAFFAYEEEGRTFLPPITLRAGEVNAVASVAFEDIALGNADADSLTAANDEINRILAE
ncbi:ABC transporter substrate-binding protein [Myceligenerans pegani]|uniref:Sugar ABC transporter substrate-binding protein n=1 Tax=Myceligenerans pegani TaxID=2776917 RepID=A0ABR9MY74_9MICO|nr:sugar ABC transporter substrate-binding protein [Myceligenerans sp. TRM 65318]MBE1876328.1 sugar ABC transporter substrate-binding protein [Myceligenerans sp. TRM 65318]MBE3018599.1 sugar ABC transporter substrate-binding protein [Myceligenerans sp. TRM 65318]